MECRGGAVSLVLEGRAVPCPAGEFVDLGAVPGLDITRGAPPLYPPPSSAVHPDSAPGSSDTQAPAEDETDDSDAALRTCPTSSTSL